MKKLFYIPFLSFLLVGISLHSQTRKELENRRKKLNKEIKKINNLLFETKKEKTNALDDLKDLSQKIIIRERLIETIELENVELSKEIKQNSKKIEQNNAELAELKDDYTKMVFKSYKSKSQQSKVMFLLSSENFLQAYKRIKYLEQYKNFRKDQGEKIIAKTDEIKRLNDSLSKKKNQKRRLISTEKNQKKEIENEKEEQEQLVTKIKGQESKYKTALRKKIREEKSVAKKIDKIIRLAIAKANKNKKGKAKKNEILLSAAEKALKANFEQNKGRLPWPLDGVVTRKFGVQPHPNFKGITINSTGLHIRGKSGDIAKSVFKGKVLVIQLLSKGRKSVFVQHGDYITAYHNLRDVYVNKGDPIKTGDKLGKIFTDKVTGKTDLVFVLFKNTNRLNPANWIRTN